jgi:small subunit ribosomal protein S8
MNMTDSVADFLTHIRNALQAGHEDVVSRSSKLNKAIAKVLKEEGFINGFEELAEKPAAKLKIGLRYAPNRKPVIRKIVRVSKPGLRIYVKSSEIPRILGGMGIVVLSTPKGVLSGQKAKKQKVGGEILCKVW